MHPNPKFEMVRIKRSKKAHLGKVMKAVCQGPYGRRATAFGLSDQFSHLLRGVKKFLSF